MDKNNKEIVTHSEVERAAFDACRNHNKKMEVQLFYEDWDSNIDMLCMCINSGLYVEVISYRKLYKINKNGKRRDIDSPTLVTRILQYVFINRISLFYRQRDNYSALNCKNDCGLNAKQKRLSVRHRLKSLFYEHRDIHFAAVIDQRKCYEHVRTKVFRKALKRLTTDKWLIDYGCNVTFCNDRLPIGTPMSPLAHHILMLDFDEDYSRCYPFYLRYADNIFVGCNSKAEAHAVLQRTRQRWWFEFGIRANRWDSHVVAIDNNAIDFCGTIYHRNEDKSYNDHNKGYAKVRQRIADAAKQATPRNWGCYFGQLVGVDSYNLLIQIQKKNMKLAELTQKIKINRSMDAPQVQAKDIQGVTISVLDYEIRQNGKGLDNWIKLLVCFDEITENGEYTGRKQLRELHGDYAGLYHYLRQAERMFGSKQAILPIEDAKIVNSCGYIFEGSTNQKQYLDEYIEYANAI